MELGRVQVPQLGIRAFAAYDNFFQETVHIYKGEANEDGGHAQEEIQGQGQKDPKPCKCM
eukprot:1159148-Pelagomonas_calceolata.AAC.17